MSLFQSKEEEEIYTENMFKCPFPVFYVLPSQEPYIKKRLAQRNRSDILELLQTTPRQPEGTMNTNDQIE